MISFPSPCPLTDDDIPPIPVFLDEEIPDDFDPAAELEKIMGETGFSEASPLLNYNELFREAEKTLYREEVLSQLMAVLISKTKPNAILVGPAGTGKTRVVEDLAHRLAVEDELVPEKLRGMCIYELPLSGLVAGCSLVGQVEEKVQEVLDFAEDPENHAILFIDEIHQMVKTSNPTYEKIAQILKPALARGQLRVIGATTTQEAKLLASDPAFQRRFSKIIVDELSKAQTGELLHWKREELLAFHGGRVELEEGLLPAVVELSEEFKAPDSHRPDCAITLLDRAVSAAIVEAGRRGLKGRVQVTREQIRQTAIRLATGNSKPDTLDLPGLRRALSAIKGQEEAKEKLILELRKHELNLFPTGKPLTMLLIGPSGVGKTEMTKIISRQVMGCAPLVLNMTEYSSSSSVNRLIGAAAGYVGSDSNAELPFDILMSNPYQVILLDEFEKCSDAVKRLFMQVFDEGVLRTNRGSEVDFSRAVIIATTNAGHTERKTAVGFCREEEETKTRVQDLASCFDLALLNRFQNLITFAGISRETYREIVEDKYRRTRERILREKGPLPLPERIPEETLEEIVKRTYLPEFGARPAQGAVMDYVYGIILGKE